MSRHSENKDVKQSPLDPDMDNEEDQIANMLISETLDRVAGNINELMQSVCRWKAEEHVMSAADGNEDESSAAHRTNQKVERELHRFFNLRRVFAEHRGEEVTEEDLVTDMDATPASSQVQVKAEHVDEVTRSATDKSPSKDIETKPSEMSPTASASSSEDISGTAEADRTPTSNESDSENERQAGRCTSVVYENSLSPPQEASSLTSVRSSDNFWTATKSDLSPVPLELVDVDNEDDDVTPEEFMEEDLVTDLDATPVASQVQLEEHVDEVIGSAISDSPAKDIETKPSEVSPTASASSSEDISSTAEADRTPTSTESDSEIERRTGRRTSVVYKKSCSPPQEASSITSVPSSDDIRTAIKSDLNTVPLDLVDVDNDDEEVPPEEFMEEDLVTDLDAKPSTSQVQLEEHVDEVVGSATSYSPSKDIETKPSEVSPTASTSSSEDISVTAEADRTPTSSESDSESERRAGRRTSVIYKKSSSPPQEASSITSVPSSDDIRTAIKSDLNTVPLELVDVDNDEEEVPPEEFMEEDLVTDLDATPSTSQVQLEEHVDEVVGSATSDSPAKDIKTKPSEVSPTASASSSEDISGTAEADRTPTSSESDSESERQAGRHTSVVYKKSSSPPQEASSITSVPSSDDIRTAIKSDLNTVPLKLVDVDNDDEEVPTEEFMEEDLVTDLDATLSTSQVQLEEHMDEVVGSATSYTPSKDIETKPSEVSPTASTSSSEDISGTAEADRTPTSSESNSESERRAGRCTSVVYKNSSSPPQEASSITSLPSSDDIRTAIKSDLNTVPLELVDVGNDDEEVPPEEFMEEDLVTDLDATPSTSQVQLEEHIDEVVGSATSYSPSKDIETKPSEVSATASTSSSEDISGTAEADRTQTSRESDSKNERLAGRRTSVVYKKMRSVWKNVFRKKRNNKVHPVPDQHEEEAVGSGSQSTQSSSPPQVASTPNFMSSSDDMKAAMKADQSTVPLEQVDVDNEDEDVTPEEFMEEDLGTDLDATPVISQVQLEEHVDEVIGSATSDSPSKDIETKPSEMSPTASTSSSEDISGNTEADRTPTSSESDSENERRAGRCTSVVYKNSSSPPQEVSSLTSVRSSDDIRTTTKSDLSPVPLELVDVDKEDEDVTPEEFMEEDQVTDIDSISGSSQVQLEAEHVDEVIGSATSDSPSKDIETKPDDMSPTSSASSREDISGTAEADRTPTSSDSDSENERQAGRSTTVVYKKMKSVWKSVFRKKRGKKVHPVPDQHEEVAVGSGSQSTSSSSPPQVASTPNFMSSSEDMKAAMKAEQSIVPLEEVDVDNEDEDVTPEEFMEEDLGTDLDATPVISQVQLEEHVDEVIGSATSDSPSKDIETKPSEMSPTASTSSSEDISGNTEADRTPTSSESDSENERQAGRCTSVVYKNSSSPPQEVSSLTSVRSSDDIRTTTKSDLSPVPLELVDVDKEDEDVTPEEFMEEDQVTDIDSISGSSQVQLEAEHVDEVIGSATSDSPSKDIETKPDDMSPTSSASSREDISGTAEADRTPTSSDSDSENERQAGRSTTVVYKKMKSVWKSVFRKKRGKKVHPVPDQHEEVAVGSGSQSTSSSSPPQVASTPNFMSSSEDMKAAMKAEQSIVPLEEVDVDNDDVTPEEFMEEDLVTDVDATPGTSHVQLEGEHMDEVVRSATSDSPSKDIETKPSEMPSTSSASSSKGMSGTAESDRTQTFRESDSKNERRAGRRTSVVYKKKRSVWKSVFRKKRGNKVHPFPVQHEEEAAGSGSQSTPSSSPPQVASTPNFMSSMKADVSPVPLELVDVDNDGEDVTPEDFMEEDLVTDLDATPVTSQVKQEEHVDEVIGSATSDSPSKDIETKPSELSPTASASSSEDISGTAEADRTPKSSKSDSKTERRAGRRTSVVYKKMRSVWKNVFRKKRNNKVHPVPDQHEEEAVGSGSQSTQSSSPLQVASTPNFMSSSEDMKAAMKADQSPVPLELVDVDNDDVTPEELMEEDLATDMDATPGTSHVQLEGEHMDEVVGSATSDLPSKDIETKPSGMSSTASTSSSDGISGTAESDRTQTFRESDSKNERRAGRRTSVVYKKTRSVWKSVFRKKRGNKVYPFPDQHEEEAAGSSSQSTPSSSPPQVASTPNFMYAMKADVNPLPLELVDVDNDDEDVMPEEFMEEDLLTDMVATPGTSQVQLEAEHVDEVIGSATSDSPSKDIETKPSEMSPTASASSSEDVSGTAEDVDDEDVIPKGKVEQMVDMCMEELRLVLEAILNTLSQAISQFAPQYGTTRSPTCSQEYSTGQVGQNLPSKLLRESFDITDDDIQKMGKKTKEKMSASTQDDTVRTKKPLLKRIRMFCCCLSCCCCNDVQE